MRFQFKFTWIPFVAMCSVVAIGISLGHWQTGRAEHKLALQAMLETRQRQAPIVLDASMTEIAAYTRVIATGHFMPAWTIYLENRPYQGQAGFYVVMPFALHNSNRIIMVVRGWLPRDASERTRIAAFATPAGPVRIQGVIQADAGQVMQLGEAPTPVAGGIMQNLDMPSLSAASQLPLLPYVLKQTQGADDGLIRDWPAPSVGVEKHHAYALQWYALALTAFIFYLVTGFKRAKK